MRHARFRLGEFPLRLKMRKAYSKDVTELETHLPDARAANCALVLLGRELNLFTEKKVLGQPGGFDQMAEKELIEFIEAQDEVCASMGTMQPRQSRSRARVLPSAGKMPLLLGLSLTRKCYRDFSSTHRVQQSSGSSSRRHKRAICSSHSTWRLRFEDTSAKSSRNYPKRRWRRAPATAVPGHQRW